MAENRSQPQLIGYGVDNTITTYIKGVINPHHLKSDQRRSNGMRIESVWFLPRRIEVHVSEGHFFKAVVTDGYNNNCGDTRTFYGGDKMPRWVVKFINNVTYYEEAKRQTETMSANQLRKFIREYELHKKNPARFKGYTQKDAPRLRAMILAQYRY